MLQRVAVMSAACSVLVQLVLLNAHKLHQRSVGCRSRERC